VRIDAHEKRVQVQIIQMVGAEALESLAAALADEKLTREQVIIALGAYPDDELLAAEQTPDSLRALAEPVAVYRKRIKGRPAAWTTGKIDKHTRGRHTHQYASPPMRPMGRPTLGIVHGFWGGRGKGDANTPPAYTVYVNDTRVGRIDSYNSGYISPGPKLDVFDLAGVADRDRIEVRIVAGSGGEAVIGEVKVWDADADDPGVITKLNKTQAHGSVRAEQ
jgi:hypothetical protein